VADLAGRLRGEAGVHLCQAAADMEVLNRVQDAGVAWLLHTSGLVLLEHQWDGAWTGPHRAAFLASLLGHCLDGGTEAGRGMLAAIVTLGSDGRDPAAGRLLEDLLRALLDSLHCSKPDEHLGDLSWLGLPHLPPAPRAWWGRLGLRLLASHGPQAGAVAVAQQAHWAEGEGGSLGCLAAALACTGPGAAEVAGSAARLAARGAAAWRGLLAIVTASLHCLPGAEAAWWHQVTALVQGGLVEGQDG
jgi:hypothetical protein